MVLNIILPIIGALVGAVAVIFILGGTKVDSISETEEKAKNLLKKSKEEADNYLDNVKNRIDEIKKSAFDENERLHNQLKKLEQILNNKETNTVRKEKRLKEVKQKIKQQEELINSKKEEGLQIRKQVEEKLIEIARIPKEEAKKELLQKILTEVELNYAQKHKKYIAHVDDNAESKAKNLVLLAIQKFDEPTSVEKNVTTVKVPRDEAKGRIVGKDGKNIKYFEEILDVNVVFNDAPNLISIGGHDLVRRAVAKEALQKLLKDKVITEAVIKKRIEEGKNMVTDCFKKAGKKAIKIVGLTNIPENLVKIIGRLQYRTSYGQNILKHSLEVSYFAALLASELKADVETCKIAGFFHDIGKAIDQEVEGSHDLLSKKIMEKYKYSDDIVHAVYAHHEAEECRTLEAVLVKAADAISAGRPGARQESLERYIERLQSLENIGAAYEGVKKTFAISAGRELRVIVDPEEILDDNMNKLAGEIAENIEENLQYPGKIKVNIIRKTQATDYAK